MSDNEASQEAEAMAMQAVARVLDGDDEAFAVILRVYERLVASDLSRRLPAQDVQEVAQDTFVRLYRSLPSFQGRVPLRVWILKIARHAALDFWRKKYRRKEMVFSDLDETAQTKLESSGIGEMDEKRREQDVHEARREWLEAALRRLSPDDRAVITLVELEETSMEEAAHRLGCGLSAVKVRAFRARRRLKDWLEKTRPGKDENP